MRFLFFTDDHKRGTSPENRKDNFPFTLAEKLREVVRIAQERKVDFVLHGGDFFDSPNPALSVCGDYLSVLAQLGVPLYVVAGNHDLYGHNLETLNRTMLGLLIRLHFVCLLTREPLYVRKNGICVQLTGQSYYYDLDNRNLSPQERGYLVQKKSCDLAVHVVHGMLLPQVPSLPTAYTLLDEVQATEADLTLAGHFHLGYPEVNYDGKYFFNPGALVRLSNHPAEINRPVQVLLFDLGGGDLCFEKISLAAAAPGKEVLDRARAEEAAFRTAKLTGFLQSIQRAGDYQRVDFRVLIEKIARTQGLEAEVKQEALRRIARAEENLG